MRNSFPEVRMDRNGFFGNGFFGFEPSLVGDFFKPMMSGAFATDIEETKEAYIVRADLPGFHKQNIDITFEDQVLTIKATRNHEVEEKKEDGTFIRKERSTGSYVRRFMVEGVREEEVKAVFRDGVLTITLPKKEEKEPKRRVIEIE